MNNEEKLERRLDYLTRLSQLLKAVRDIKEEKEKEVTELVLELFSDYFESDAFLEILRDELGPWDHIEWSHPRVLKIDDKMIILRLWVDYNDYDEDGFPIGSSSTKLTIKVLFREIEKFYIKELEKNF